MAFFNNVFQWKGELHTHNNECHDYMSVFITECSLYEDGQHDL